MLSLCCNVWTLRGDWGVIVEASSLLSQCLDRFSQGAFSSLRLPTSLPPLLWLCCAIIVKCEYDHMFPVSCVMEHLYTQILDTIMFINLFSINIGFLRYERELICCWVFLNLSIDGSVNYEAFSWNNYYCKVAFSHLTLKHETTLLRWFLRCFSHSSHNTV